MPGPDVPQHGAISYAQARSLGMTTQSITRRVEAGEWIRIFPRVYVLATYPHSWEQRAAAALLWAGVNAVASHRTAAALFNLDGVKRGPIDVSVSSARRSPARDVVVHRHRLSPGDIGKLGPLRVTTAARTLVDLGAVVDEETVELALDGALRRKLTTNQRPQIVLARAGGRGHRGAGVLRKLLEARGRDARPTESAAETLCRRIIRKFRLPPAELQYRVRVAGRWRRLDFAYPALKLGIEVDGKEEHMKSFEDDHDREALLMIDGWTILRFTWRQVRHRPEIVAERVRRVLDRLA